MEIKQCFFCLFLILFLLSCSGEEVLTPKTFLEKHSDTVWADPDDYYGKLPDVKFSDQSPFISFFDISPRLSYCESLSEGETIYDGVKWNIVITKNDEDTLEFEYSYYGFDDELEYTIVHLYSVANNLLIYSNSTSESFVFHPSQKNYSIDSLDTEEIISLQGCSF